MDLREYYKEHYTLEVTRRHELTNALALPLGVMSLLIGGLLIIAKEIHPPFDVWKLFQLGAIVQSFALYAVTAYFLVRSYYNYEYGYAPTPKEIKDYREGLVSFYLAMGSTDDEAKRKADYEALEHIDNEYANHAHRNTQNNDRKSSCLHWANGFLIASVVSTVVAGVPYFAGSISSPSEAHKVEVVNIKEAVMTTPPKNQNQQPATTQQQTTPTQVPSKPSPPPGRVIREHVDPTKKK